MLVLTRKIGESIKIGNNAEVDVAILGIRDNQVKVGIDAPKNISVHREEIYQRIQAGKQISQQMEEKQNG